jgi:hypothetical protein
MSRIKQIVMFGGVSLLSVVVQFLTWAFASGNTARPLAPNTIADIGYAVASFPVTFFLRHALYDGFWALTFFNAVLWGVVALTLTRLWLAYHPAIAASR